jgi:Flp pilus assembly protein TadG
MNNSPRIIRSSGVVMVEFAIILPLLVLLLFGITEIGRALYQQNMLHRALTVGARYLTHQEGIVALDATNGTCAKVNDANYSYNTAEDYAKNLILCGEEDCTGKEPFLQNLTYGNITVTLDNNAVLYDTTNNLYACVIKVDAQADFAGLFNTIVPFTDIANPTLNAKTEVRYIGY